MNRLRVRSRTLAPPRVTTHDARVGSFLRAGVALRLDGYWRSRNFKGTKLFEFVAQYIAIGDEPRIPGSGWRPEHVRASTSRSDAL